MKHVFCISSNLAFSICDHLIHLDNLPISDCIFFTTRNYHLPDKGNIYHVIETTLNSSKNEGRLFAGWKFWNTNKNIKHIDQIIHDITQGEDYIFYTQVCWNDLCSVFVTNKRCKGYYILEDGSGSYRNEEQFTFHGWKAIIYKVILKPIFPRVFALKGKMIEVNHPKFKGCIATNNMCFPLHQDKLRVIGLPFHPKPLDKQPDAIISLDPYYLWLTDEQVEQVFIQLGAYIKRRHYSNIVFKPHPYLLTAENKERYVFYKNCLYNHINPNLTELGAKISLEDTLMAHRDCDFYTAVSSVAIYAKAMNVKCYTFAPLLRQYCDLHVPVVENLCIPINP